MSKSDDNDISFAFERLSLCTDANENASHTNVLTENIFQAIDIIRNKKRKRPELTHSDTPEEETFCNLSKILMLTRQ